MPAQKGSIPHNRKDIRNKRFGSLVALCPTGASRNRSRVWHCACDCGNGVDATVRDLERNAVKSCGCRRHRTPASSHSIEHNLHFVDGTCVENLLSAQSRPVTNKTGVKGVFYNEITRKYVVYIGFQGKSHYIGQYDFLSDAAGARADAEQKYHVQFLEAYFKNTKAGKN